MSNKKVNLLKFKSKEGKELLGLVNVSDSRKGVVFAHGFEGTTIESRTKRIIDNLSGKTLTLQFDFAGSPFYRGKIEDFKDLTVQRCKEELKAAITALKKSYSFKKVIIVAHSLGCCAVLKLISEENHWADKVVFLAPSFNQKELLKYWFVKSANKDKDIDWNNFKDYFSEKEYMEEMSQEKREVGEHYISNKYFFEDKDIDYQDLFSELKVPLENILVVYGDKDDVVPPRSNDRIPKEIRKIEVPGGNHNLAAPSMMEVYLEKLVNFILED